MSYACDNRANNLRYKSCEKLTEKFQIRFNMSLTIPQRSHSPQTRNCCLICMHKFALSFLTHVLCRFSVRTLQQRHISPIGCVLNFFPRNLFSHYVISPLTAFSAIPVIITSYRWRRIALVKKLYFT